MDIKVQPGPAVEPFEYLCRSCGQLRLAFVAVAACGNCGSASITKGPLGSLQKP